MPRQPPSVGYNRLLPSGIGKHMGTRQTPPCGSRGAVLPFSEMPVFPWADCAPFGVREPAPQRGGVHNTFSRSGRCRGSEKGQHQEAMRPCWIPAARMLDAAPRPTSGAGHDANRRAGNQRQRTAKHFPPKSERAEPSTPPIGADRQSKPARKVAKWQDSHRRAIFGGWTQREARAHAPASAAYSGNTWDRSMAQSSRTFTRSLSPAAPKSLVVYRPSSRTNPCTDLSAGSTIQYSAPRPADRDWTW